MWLMKLSMRLTDGVRLSEHNGKMFTVVCELCAGQTSKMLLVTGDVGSIALLLAVEDYFQNTFHDAEI